MSKSLTRDCLFNNSIKQESSLKMHRPKRAKMSQKVENDISDSDDLAWPKSAGGGSGGCSKGTRAPKKIKKAAGVCHKLFRILNKQGSERAWP